MSKPVIALFMPSLAGGGVQRSMLLLAEGLLKRGVDIDLVVGQAIGPFRDKLPNGVNLVDLHLMHLRNALPGLCNYMKATPPDALLSVQTHANIIAILAGSFSRCKAKVVVAEHNDMRAVVRGAGLKPDRFRPILARFLYPFADQIVAVSRGVAESLAACTGFSQSKIKIIYNPLIPLNLEELTRTVCPHPWLQPGCPPVILAVGRLTVQKDYPTLLRALKRLEVRTKLVILGEGPERPKLVRLINELSLSDQVDMPGFVDNPYSFMSRAGVFVLSSAWEGFPSVLVEAMACGARVVATNCPSGPAEILENGRFGSLVTVGDAAGLAREIARALSQPTPDAAAMIQANRFTIEKATDEYLHVLLGGAV